MYNNVIYEEDYTEEFQTEWEANIRVKDIDHENQHRLHQTNNEV